MGLEKLLYLQGVGAEFIDCVGNLVHIPAKDRQGILTTMLLPASFNHQCDPSECAQILTDTNVAKRIEQLDVSPWLEPLHRFQWCEIDSPHIDIQLPDNYPFAMKITVYGETIDTLTMTVAREDFVVVGEYYINGQRYCQYRLILDKPNLHLGYHQISLAFIDDVDRPHTLYGQIMIAPQMAYQGRMAQVALAGQSRPWGINAQLYAMRNEEQWGIGDFGNLAELIDYAARNGADFILLNPLHALDISQPENPSPYSPTDRRRLNPLYIQIEGVHEYKAIAAELTTQKWLHKKHLINQSQLIDYSEVHSTKYAIFEKLYHIFCQQHVKQETSRYLDYLAFVEKDKPALMQFVEREIALASNSLNVDAGFYLYLQFVANEQLDACQINAKQYGMSIGLIRDLAVGAVAHGAEVSANVGLFCDNASIGAPPDPFAEHGQNWGLAPIDPVKLKQQDFSHFIQLIRSNMQSCGALRIDHVMSLLRLWWWPLNRDLGEGSYVYYPLDTLLAIVCLESQRARCIVVGEDLGTVPPEIVSRLQKAGIFSNELFYFCKDHNGFKLPKDYKQQSLMMLANHDVPTITAWWTADDLMIRRQLDLIDSDHKLQQLLAERNQEKQQLVELLIHEGALVTSAEKNTDDLDFDTVILAWLSVVAGGYSQLFSVQLSDLVTDKHGVNIPGTWKEFPNWQRRLPLSIHQMSQNPKVQQRISVIKQSRQASSHVDAANVSLPNNSNQ